MDTVEVDAPAHEEPYLWGVAKRTGAPAEIIACKGEPACPRKTLTEKVSALRDWDCPDCSHVTVHPDGRVERRPNRPGVDSPVPAGKPSL